MSSKSPDESFAAMFESAAPQHRGVTRRRRGDRLDVTVVAIGRDAVFVDLGGKQEGYFERGEMVDKKGEPFVSVGSVVQAIVVEADGERVRLSPVSIRRSDSAELVDETGETVHIPIARSGSLLVEGARVRGTVTGVERYGAFIQLEGTQGRHGRGLLPVQEMGLPRGADLQKHFPVGTAIETKIVAVAPDGKIRLSIRALAQDVERDEYAAYQTQQSDAGGESDGEASGAHAPGPKAQGRGKGGAKPAPQVRGFGTLGDLLSKSSAAAKKR
jgi:small subunit ribosomal protein S1